jgi:hypothetical protein
MKQMVDENIECALHIDDDAVFYKDWKLILESIPDEIRRDWIHKHGYFTIFQLWHPKLKEVYQIPNNGGMEVFWVNTRVCACISKSIKHGRGY